jgi:ribosomal protein L3
MVGCGAGSSMSVWRQLYKIDTVRNLLFVKGHVPGNNGAWVRVSSSRRSSCARPCVPC